MKSVHYLATVVRVYREALDRMAANPAMYAVSDLWRDELDKIASRGYTTGFFNGPPVADMQEYETVRVLPEWEYSGLVRQWDAGRGMAFVEQRNHMQLDDEIEIIRPNGTIFRQTLAAMTDADGTPIDRAPHPQQLLWLRLTDAVGDYSMIRRRRRNGRIFPPAPSDE